MSVIRQKGKSQNGCFKKTKQAKFSEKQTFPTPWYTHTHMCVSGGKKCSFFGKFGFLWFLETLVLRFTLLPYYRRFHSKIYVTEFVINVDFQDKMAGYHVSTCRLLYRYILSIIGIIIGLSAAGCFGGVYHNYHAAGWGLVSGVFALLAFILHVKVRRDSSCSIRPAFFIRLKKIGIFGAVLGVAVFIGYLIKGILVHETGKY